MRRAIYPGSFDPVTNGHLDIIERGSKLFDEIVIAVLNNPDKNPLFSIPERCDMIREVLRSVDHHGCSLVVEDFAGLTVDFAQKKQAGAIVRGIRAISDYEYELQMASMNRRLGPEIETVFMMASEKYSFVSSKLIKQVFALGGAVGGLVPPLVETQLREKLH
jgi:pantetheine-phosphate adenylyltransferase